MFFSGQPIEITSSSAKKRSHPNIGDKGFISAGAIILYCGSYFALLEAYFYQYGDDDSPCRCERKLFLMCDQNDVEAMRTATNGIVVSDTMVIYALTYEEVLYYINAIRIGAPFGINLYKTRAFNTAYINIKSGGKLIKPAICNISRSAPIPVERNKYVRAAWFRATNRYLTYLTEAKSDALRHLGRHIGNKYQNCGEFFSIIDRVISYEAGYARSKEYLPPFKVENESLSILRISNLTESANRAKSFVLNFIDSSNDPLFLEFKQLLNFHRSVGSSCAALNRFYELCRDNLGRF